MAILTFISILFRGVHKVFLQYDRSRVNVLDQDHTQSLAEAVVVLVWAKVPHHLSSPLVSSVETGTRYMTGHEMPDIYNRKQKLATSSVRRRTDR